jgi:hypothetical protein
MPSVPGDAPPAGGLDGFAWFVEGPAAVFASEVAAELADAAVAG